MRYDELAWHSIHNRPPSKTGNKGLANSGRPMDYAELTQVLARGDEWELAEPWVLRDSKVVPERLAEKRRFSRLWGPEGSQS
jgi:hypothetical protein